ncbi:MAG: hypothetical protein QNL01_09555 [Akkermansiaceae bacterium]
MQAVPKDPKGADVTVYRNSAKEAIAWKDQEVVNDRYSYFLLRHGDRAWDVYGSDGKIDSYCTDVVGSHVQEYFGEETVDMEAILEEAKASTFEHRVKIISHVENIASVPATLHANFAQVMRRLVLDAPPSDLHHIYLVDSRQYKCRVVSVCANLARMSLTSQNAYLDVHLQLKSNLPIQADHHLDTLASRLLEFRSEYVAKVIEVCCAQKQDPELEASFKLRWHLVAKEHRHAFCHRLTRLMADAIEFNGVKPETFAEPALMVRSLEILDLIRGFLPTGVKNTP